MSPAEHELKCWPNYFKDLMNGKTFEVRRDDRSFRVGDTLRLRECQRGGVYTGREMVRRVTYILPGDQHGIEKGYVVMAMAVSP